MHTTIWDSTLGLKDRATYVLTLELVETQKRRGGCKYELNFHCIAYQSPFLDSVQVYNLFYDLFICL